MAHKPKKGAPATHIKAMIAHSDAAPPDQDKRSRILQCIRLGLSHIGIDHAEDPSDQIVWGSLTVEDCNGLAGDLESCLRAKGIVVPSLAANFQFLRQDDRVMTVGSLIDALIEISV